MHEDPTRGLDGLQRAFETLWNWQEKGAPGSWTEFVAQHADQRELLEPLLAEHDKWRAEQQSKQVGPYRLTRVLGEGGMGKVWLAEQREPMRRRVALKLLAAGRESKEMLARFESERETLALMDHPNVARVLDAGTSDDGRPFIAMEHVPGLPIQDYCDHRKLNVRSRLELFIDVCRGVQHAHQRGVIHRDLKPSNILVLERENRGVPKIIDFGIAKATGPTFDDRSIHTEAGRFLGTPGYMSPEQAQMTDLGVDTRADVYSLGVVLYELLTGTLPLEMKILRGANLAELQRHICEDQPPRPSTRLSTSDEAGEAARNRNTQLPTLHKQVRGELDWIVMKAIEKEPLRRYQSVADFSADIKRYLADEPVLASPPSRSYLFRKFLRRHKGPVAAGVLVALALVAGATVAFWQFTVARQNQQIAERNARDSRDNLALAKQNEATAKRNEQRARKAEREAKNALERAEGHRLSALSETMLEDAPVTAALLAIKGMKQAPGEEATNALYGALSRCHERKTLSSHRGYVRDIAMSPDNQLLLSSDLEGVAILWNLTTFEIAHRWSDEVNAVELAFSPDSKRFVIARSNVRDPGVLHVHDSATAARIVSIPVPKMIEKVRFTLDGTRILVGHTDGSVRSYEQRTDAEPALLTQHATPVRQLALSPDGSRVATLSKHDIRICTLQGNRPAVTIALAERGPPSLYGRPRFDRDHKRQSIVFASDGRSVIARTRRGHAGQWNASDGTLLKDFTRPDRFIRALVVATKTSRVLTLESEYDNRIEIRIHDLQTGEARTSRASFEMPGHALVRCDASGEKLLISATSSGPIVWDLRLDSRRSHIGGHLYEILDGLFFADGQRLATCSKDGSIRLWDIDAMREHQGLAGPDVPNHREILAVSPLGNRAAILIPAGTGRRLVIADTIAGTVVQRVLDSSKEIPEVRFSGDGNRLLLSGPGPRLRVHDIEQGRQVMEIAGAYRWARLDRPGKRLAGAVVPSNADQLEFSKLRFGPIHVFDVGSGKRTHVLKGEADDCAALRFSASSDLLAVADRSAYSASIFDLKSSRLVHRVRDPSAWVVDVAFTPDDKELVVFAVDTTIRSYRIGSWESRLAIVGAPPTDAELKIAASGQHLLLHGSSFAHLYNFENGSLLARLSPGRGDAFHRDGGYSRDGESLMLVYRSGTIRFFPVDPLAWATSKLPRTQLDPLEMRRFGIGTKQDRSRVHREMALGPRVVQALERLRTGDIAGATQDLEAETRKRRWAAAPQYGLACAYSRRSATWPADKAGKKRRRQDLTAALAAAKRAVELGWRSRSAFERSPHLEPLRRVPRLGRALRSLLTR